MLKNEIIIKNHEQLEQQVKVIQMLKEDLRAEQGLSSEKLQLANEKEVNVANRSLNSTINDVILVQLKAIDAHQETMTG